MKNSIVFSLFLSLLIFDKVNAQSDSTTKGRTTAFAIYFESGLLNNSSMTSMRKSLNTRNIEPFKNAMNSLVLARRSESARWMSEGRLIFMTANKNDNELDKKRAALMGFGVGFVTGPKLVNTKHWNIFVPFGLDLMAYQMNIKSNYSASLAAVTSDPSKYLAVKLYSGALNASLGGGVDYKTNILPKKLSKFYISGKLTYQLPIYTTGQWKGENSQVNDMASFKPNQLFAQIGVVLAPKFSVH